MMVVAIFLPPPAAQGRFWLGSQATISGGDGPGDGIMKELILCQIDISNNVVCHL